MCWGCDVTPEVDNEVALVRLEGKIDALSAKLDGRLDAVMAKIDAGDRESLQLFELQKSEVGHVSESVRANTVRIAAIELAIADLPTIRRLVYGTATLLLTAVVIGLANLVINQP